MKLKKKKNEAKVTIEKKKECKRFGKDNNKSRESLKTKTKNRKTIKGEVQ